MCFTRMTQQSHKGILFRARGVAILRDGEVEDAGHLQDLMMLGPLPFLNLVSTNL